MQHLSTKDYNSLLQNSFGHSQPKRAHLRIVSANDEVFRADAPRHCDPDYHNFELDIEPRRKSRAEAVLEGLALFFLALLFVCLVILAHHHGADIVAQFARNAY